MSRSRRPRRRCPHPWRPGSGPGGVAASPVTSAAGVLRAVAASEDTKASRAELSLSLVPYLLYQRREGRPEIGPAAEASVAGFQHRARAPSERTPPHCMPATMRDKLLLQPINGDTSLNNLCKL